MNEFKLKYFKTIHKDYALALIAYHIDKLGWNSYSNWVIKRDKVLEADRLVGEFKARERLLQSSIYSS